MKYVLMLMILGVCAGFAGTASSQADNPKIADLLKSQGELVWLKAEQIPGKLADGTPEAMRDVTYQGSLRKLDNDVNPAIPGAFKLSCLAEYTTARLSFSESPDGVVEGLDADIPEGKTESFKPENFGVRYELKPLDNGNFDEVFEIRFYQDGPTLVEISCDVVLKDKNQLSTVKDFEEATGGRMTLKAGN